VGALAQCQLSKQDVAQSIRDLLDAGNVSMNQPAVRAGLSVVEAGRDLADGVIALDRSVVGRRDLCAKFLPQGCPAKPIRAGEKMEARPAPYSVPPRHGLA